MSATALGMEHSLQALQARVGHRFSTLSLLERAITHRSSSTQHNERLEYLGDAVLNLAVSQLLYARFADSDEGDLTRVRAHLVREDSLHRVALDLGLPAVVRLSDGEARGGGAQRPSILADTVEAIIGAVHLDAGFDAAKSLVQRWFGGLIDRSDMGEWGKDPKTELQERLQARKLPVPAYKIRATRGQAHAQTFEVECEIPAYGLSAVAEGRSKRAAEQEAARRMLALLPNTALRPPPARGAA